MRVVLDTNIYIAAALYSGLAKDTVDFILENSFITLISSAEILDELAKKLQFKFGWSEERISSYLNDIKSMAEIVQIEEKLDIIKRDPEDNKILECALSGKADLIVTMDQDLLKLKSFRGIGIVHPKTLSWTFPDYFKN